MNARLFLKSALATLLLGTAGAAATHAQQPSLFNPLTWFNTPTYRPAQPCATGTCPNVRPVGYQTNYAPAVANTYYYPQSGYTQPAYNPAGYVQPQAGYVQPINAYPNAAGVNASCPNGVCPTGQCVNGQCPTGACPNGNCNLNCVNGQCFPTTSPVYYGGSGAATSPYYTSQTQPVNYVQPVQYPAATQPMWNAPAGNVPPSYVPPFRGRAADLPMEYGVNYR